MDELKLVSASNIIKLRTAAGMTQLELGEKLNYSDKTISKWERGEAIPDAYVLSQMGKIFGVTVDYILTEHDEWDGAPKNSDETVEKVTFSTKNVTLASVAGIWTLAMLVFVVFWLLGHVYGIVFASAVPVTLVTLLVFNSVWRKGKRNELIVSLLLISIVSVVYIAVNMGTGLHPWQMYLLLIPAELVVFFSFRIVKRGDKKSKKSKAGTDTANH